MTISEINRLIEEYGTDVYRFCCRLTGKKEDADDLYQETMLKAIEKSSLIRKAENPKSYLIGMTVKLWSYWKRRESRRQRIAPMQEMNEETMQVSDGNNMKSPETVVLEKELEQQVRQVVEALPERMRTIIYMYYTAELSVQDIAKATGLPNGTVKSRLFRARQMVKDAMEENAYDK